MNDATGNHEKDDMTIEAATPEQADIGARIGRWLGDLDHPLYDDERARWVWYEGSAIGLQAALLSSYVIAGLVVIGDSSRVPWVVLMMLPVSLGAILAAGHSQRHSATYAPTTFDFTRSRGIAILAVVAFFMTAVIISGLRDDSYLTAGLAGALPVGLAAGIVAARAQSNRELAAAEAETDDDLD